MWPREFLKQDLPNSRVMTFEYNTKLSDGTAHTFEDFCMQFLSNLKLARQDNKVLAPVPTLAHKSTDTSQSFKRDLVIIGHSYGGRVITTVSAFT
jgi:hypothetical protein